MNKIIDFLKNNQILLVFFLILLIWFTLKIIDILMIFFVAYIISTAFSPATSFLYERKIPRLLSVLIPYLLIVITVVLLAFPFVPLFYSQIQSLVTNIPSYLDEVTRLIGIDVNELELRSIIASQLETIGQNLLFFTGQLFTVFFSITTTLIISIYLTYSEDWLKNSFASLFPPEYEHKIIGLLENIKLKLGKWIRGQIILSLVVGFLVWVSMTLIGLDFTVGLGVIAAILEIIPTIGPVLAALPAFLIGISVSTTTGIIVIAAYILIQVIESNLLAPVILSQVVGIHPLILIPAVLIGGRLMGILGALLAVPFVVVVATIITEIANLKKE